MRSTKVAIKRQKQLLNILEKYGKIQGSKETAHNGGTYDG